MRASRGGTGGFADNSECDPMVMHFRPPVDTTHDPTHGTNSRCRCRAAALVVYAGSASVVRAACEEARNQKPDRRSGCDRTSSTSATLRKLSSTTAPEKAREKNNKQKAGGGEADTMALEELSTTVSKLTFNIFGSESEKKVLL